MLENFSTEAHEDVDVAFYKKIQPVFRGKDTAQLSTEIGNYMRAEITDFYAIYLKFIPLDIFKELHSIYKSVEISILFSDTAYLLQTKQDLIETRYIERYTPSHVSFF
ncbi:hypothetical protein GQR36_13705 [Enterococcus termitis]|uniref:Uncharacterized protein n=1 Tax=Enterococcus termitis TaxID=332950 RepID=A0A1E5GIM1_9ENTE|nr:hypothetical protein BCR25_19665 [Enterococcus termitis]OJG93924.1 hypothetical protein RV18_GL003423 [Enterococcus termitis]